MRRVWQEAEHGIFVVTETEFLNLGDEGDPGLIVGFPIRDGFEVGETTEEELIELHQSGRLEWEEIVPRRKGNPN